MTNEISAGLGVRQPTGSIGGSAPFGMYKVDILGQNLNAMKDSGAQSAVLLQTVTIGTIKLATNAQLWVGAEGITLTSGSTVAFNLAVAVRDSTLLSSLSTAKMVGNTAPAFGGNIVATATAPTLAVGAVFPVNNSYKVGGTDDFANTIAQNDVLVVDVYLVANKNVATYAGSADIHAWFTILET